MKKCNCPKCNKELIRLMPFVKGKYEFYCDDCDIDIAITNNEEVEIDYDDRNELPWDYGKHFE